MTFKINPEKDLKNDSKYWCPICKKDILFSEWHDHLKIHSTIEEQQLIRDYIKKRLKEVDEEIIRIQTKGYII
jgi:hypothetical protein